ncbi:MAG TPA: hypothetical protein VGR54_08895 [Nitrosopumilaceae archaeon]|nr:hypothetical protein [Nitrosopumilaceae archaeon]
MLDNSKKVFLSPSCLKDKTVMERILQVLDGYNVPKDRVFLEVNMNILNSGDYIIRCSDEMAKLFEVQMTVPFGFTTNLVGKI